MRGNGVETEDMRVTVPWQHLAPPVAGLGNKEQVRAPPVVACVGGTRGLPELREELGPPLPATKSMVDARVGLVAWGDAW